MWGEGSAHFEHRSQTRVINAPAEIDKLRSFGECKRRAKTFVISPPRHILTGSFIPPMSLIRTFTQLLGCSIFVAAVAAAPVLAQDAAPESRGELFEKVPLPAGLLKDDVRDATAAVLGAREWTVQVNTDLRLVGYLKQRSNEATVTLVCDGATMDIYCAGWQLNRTGERVRPEMPRSWLVALRRDLARRFDELAKQPR